MATMMILSEDFDNLVACRPRLFEASDSLEDTCPLRTPSSAQPRSPRRTPWQVGNATLKALKEWNEKGTLPAQAGSPLRTPLSAQPRLTPWKVSNATLDALKEWTAKMN